MKTRPRDVWRFLAATRACYPNFNPPLRYVLEKKWDLGGRIDTLFCPTRGLDRHQLFVTERILELPFVHRALDQPPGSRILEFGCANSQLCIELASRGMMVTGVDLRAHPLTHPNFVFCQGDFFDQDLGYYRRTNHSAWLPATANELAQVEWHPSGHGAEGVVLIAARCLNDVLETQA